MDDPREVELETGHVLVYCGEHGQEYCHRCCVDYRDINIEARRESEAELSKKKAKHDQKIIEAEPCNAEGCDNRGISLCSRCRAVGYCSVECQRKDWKIRHKKECEPTLPSFTNSITKKKMVTYPIGTEIDMIGGMQPLRAIIRKYNPAGTGNPSDRTASDLATYTLQTIDMHGKSTDPEMYEEPCEDVHDKHSWKRLLTWH